MEDAVLGRTCLTVAQFIERLQQIENQNAIVIYDDVIFLYSPGKGLVAVRLK
jgi:hypothetical protein